MLGIFLVGVCYTKVVNNNAESDVTSILLSEASGEGYNMVPNGGKGSNQLIAGHLDCLSKAINALSDLLTHT
jgi:hypothetical protein